ncbi:hypothetical protein [Sapientia aquatica]|uniref:DUF3108 domain-containing protein n=1 Tax=Sapientia aquatica TaxID=1549640 RepID=A0A4R5VWH8_9BURK|nr:hypothetical protein [Sapientia aquatica]TDK63536.1 hypothetical protein E2I14_15150 [Sapientia aquatica]
MRFINSKILRIAVLFLATLNLAHAQSVDAPTFVGGEKWEYQKRDLWTDKVSQRFTVKILGVSGDFVRRSFETTNISNNGEIMKPQSSEMTGRADLNETVIFHGEKMTKLWYQWPLQPGKKWSFQFRAELAPSAPNAAPQIMTTNINAEVKGWETVEIASGKVKAIKIEYKSNWTTDSPASTGDTVNTVWYCPELKTQVKNVFETFAADGSPQARTVTALVLYQAKP